MGNENSDHINAAYERLINGKSGINDLRREFGLSPIDDDTAEQLLGQVVKERMSGSRETGIRCNESVPWIY